MAGSGERMVRANGLDFCMESFGREDATPLVLVMGLGAQMTAWDDGFCAALADRGFRVIRFDNRDIGRSSRLEHLGVPNIMALMEARLARREIETPYALKDMAVDTAALMDTLGIERAHVVGASMGGMIGQEMAIHMPQRMRSFTSIFSSTGDPKLPQATMEAMAVLTTPAPAERAAYIRHQANVLKVIRGPNFPEEAAEDESRAARTFDRGLSPTGFVRQFAAVIKSGNRTEALKSVKVPTLVIHGDADPLVRFEAGQATARAIPGARFEVIPGMGHSLPRKLWPRLTDLIASHAKAN
jgi:pimeloyl-ACP methyl ester carboxylesterase